MRKQSLRIILYSSLAILLLTLVWGWRQIPGQTRLSDEAVRSSVDQELIVLSGAVKSATQALRYRLLDVLKAEGTERTSRTFQDSPFLAASLLEKDQTQWKMLWYSVKSKTDLQEAAFQALMKDWPLDTLAIDETFYRKVADIQGQAYFAVLVPVRRPNQVPMIGVGIFPAGQFGLSFAADQNREVRVFDNQGAALALSHPAYLGASLKSETLVQQMLSGDESTFQQEWKDQSGRARVGAAARVPESNLSVAVETKLRSNSAWLLQSWMYLILCALGAAAVNWFLFSNLLKPLFRQLAQSDAVNEKLRRQISEAPAPEPVAQPEASIPGFALPKLDFVESPSVEAPESVSGGAPLSKVVQASLRSLDPQIKEHGIEVLQFGLDDVQLQGDSLQLQTAIEEVLKNAIEAMAESSVRNLTLSGRVRDGRVALTVEDSGHGIAEGNLGKVFDPFFSTKDSEGVSRGLGLNVVRRVIEELGGVVRLTSHRSLETSGTRVEMDWPQAAVARTVTPEDTAQASAAPAATVAEPMEELALNEVEDEADEFSMDALTKEIMTAPLKPVVRRPKVIARTLD